MGYPNFTRYGYRISQELGANRAGGRVTYLATDIETLKKVVIKQFQFASTQANWSGFDAHQREIEVLRGLNHPGICRYLHSFQTQDGFCLVQDYKNALPLSIARSFDFAEIQQIAIALLEILIYLQGRIPPVIHRDIKPENILVDEHLSVYLIDFGFARLGNGEVGISSVVKGTLGFMPPEQLFNRELSEASDLYSLGMTLICLLTHTKSSEIGNLVDVTYRINFRQSLPKVNARWIAWLEKMVEPKVANRFANAAIALAELPKQPIYLPEVLLSQAEVSLKATTLRQRLSSVVSITNFTPGTCLEGRWEIAPHPGDLHTQTQMQIQPQHPWIAIEPMEFVGNQIECTLKIDTSRLIAGKLYRRELLLHSNAADRKQSLGLQVQTAPAKLQAGFPVGLLALLFVASLVLAWILTWVVIIACTVPSIPAGFGAIAGAAVGLEIAAWLLSVAGARAGAVVGSTAGVAAGLLALFIVATENLYNSMAVAIAAALVGSLGGLALGGLAGVTAELFARKSGNHRLAVTLTLATASAAVSVGLVQAVGFSHPLLLAGVVASWLPFVTIASYLPLARLRLVQEQQTTRPQFKP